MNKENNKEIVMNIYRGWKLYFYFIVLLFLFDFIIYVIPYGKLDSFLKRDYSVSVYDRNEKLIYITTLENGLRREYVENIPDAIKKIFINSEDKRFFFHNGVDIFAIIRALMLNLRYKKMVSGGSTITMQLSRIFSPTPKNIFGKILEIINAIRLERKLSKDTILKLWINNIPFGYNSEGITDISRKIFGKRIEDLTYYQIIYLSMIPRNPKIYTDLSNIDRIINVGKALCQKNNIEFNENLFIEQIKEKNNFQYENKAWHFVNSLFKEEDLKKLKRSKKIITSLDLDLQIFSNELLKNKISFIEDYRVNNGAILVINNITGEILTYIGSANFFDFKNSGQIDGVKINRQPGSILKPYIYAYSFEKGFWANSVLPDVYMEFGGENIYIPQNFNKQYNGPVRIRVALASSLNVPAIYITKELTVKKVVNKLIDWGFETLIPQQSKLGVGIAIGECEVSLFENVRAFSVFCRGGTLPNLHYLKTNAKENGKRIINTNIAALMVDILKDRDSRVIGFGSGKKFIRNFDYIIKTGTSNQFNNIWAIGSNKYWTIGVWMGNFSGETVIKKTGSSVPADIMLTIMDYLVKKNPYLDLKEIKINNNLEKRKICALSGKEPTEYCKNVVTEYFLPFHKHEKCDFHLSDGKIKLPEIYRKWQTKKEFVIEESNELKFIEPNNNSTYYFDKSIPEENQEVIIKLVSRKDDTITIYLNNSFYKKLKYPFIFYFPIKTGIYYFKAVSEKIENNTDELKIKVY